jgi:hypothetical protein
MKSKNADFPDGAPFSEPAGEGRTPPNLSDPRVVLSLLEADQVVAAKQQTKFGRRELSFRVRLLLWSLRVYVVVMLVLVVIFVVRTIYPVR